MEEIGQKPPGMVLEPCKKMGFQLPTSSGERWLSEPSNVPGICRKCHHWALCSGHKPVAVARRVVDFFHKHLP